MLRRLMLCLTLAAGLGVPADTRAERVSFGLPIWSVQYAYVHYGEALGFFAEEGITGIDKVAAGGSTVLLPQVANGQLDFAFANPDIAVIALAKGQPLPVRFVMNWLRGQTFEFVTLEGSDVRTLADLKGRRLGVGALTWGNIPLSRAMLADAGLAWGKDVQILPVGTGAAAWRRLERGEVDALNLFVGEHGRMELAGIKLRRLPMPPQFRSIFSNGIVTSEAMIRDNPDRVAGFGRALAKGWIACKANLEACVRAYWAATPAARPAPGNEAAQLETDMRQVLFDAANVDDFPAGSPALYGHYPDGAWERLLAVMAAEGQIPTPTLDVAQLMTNRFAESFNAFDAGAVRKAAQGAP